MSNSYWESFKEQNKDLWHFDPSVKSEDFAYVGRLKTSFKPLLDLMSDDKNYSKFNRGSHWNRVCISNFLVE